MAESFPNAENTFRDAFNLPDPTPKLLELIRALVNLKNSDKISVAGYDRLGNPTQIQIVHALKNEFEELLCSDLAGVEDVCVTPSNEYLFTSLISAAVVKHRLCNSAAFYNAVSRSLYYQVETGTDPTTHEVLVLGACLLLSISGSYLYGSKHTNGSHVLSALKKIKEAGLLRHPDGQLLLEVTIRQAEDGFKSNIDGWGVLFPQFAKGLKD